MQFRDVRYVVPFLTQFWMFATPVAYPEQPAAGAVARRCTALNPMAASSKDSAGRCSARTPPGTDRGGVRCWLRIALLVGGAFYFRRMERTFADVV